MLHWADIIFNNSSNSTGKYKYFVVIILIILIIMLTIIIFCLFVFPPPFAAPSVDDGAPSICLYCLCPGPNPSHTGRPNDL